MLVRTRHLVGLISGVLILSVLLPVGLSIWLAHQQVETSFIEELDTYSSRVAIFRKWFISITTFPSVRLWSMKVRPIPSPSQVKFRKMVIVSG